MFNLLASEGRTSSAYWVIAPIASIRVKMGKNDNGLCDRTSESIEEP